jgi:hypothetical protein
VSSTGWRAPSPQPGRGRTPSSPAKATRHRDHQPSRD